MSIENLRAQINGIDEKILGLLSERVALALETAAMKRNADGSQAPVYVPAREKEILMRLASLNTSALSAVAIEHIFQTVIEECRNLQHERLAKAGAPITVSVQGHEGSFSEQAARMYISRRNIKSASIAYGAGSQNVLDDLLEKKADLGLMAINNTWGGLVTETVNALTDSRYEVIDTIAIMISQNLMALKGTRAADVAHIYSHPQALKQCRDYLKVHYPHVTLHETTDTAQAAADLHDNKLEENSAVIGSQHCIKVYHLAMLAADIHDVSHNETLFFVVKTLDR
jgi:chorismate mutase